MSSRLLALLTTTVRLHRVNQPGQRLLQRAKTDALLLQSQVWPQPVVTQIVEYTGRIGGQAREITQQGLLLVAPSSDSG